MTVHEIELIERTPSGWWYIDGQSGKLAAGLIPPDPKGYSWFCFETLTVAEGCVELMKLGFTVKQIEEALNG